MLHYVTPCFVTSTDQGVWTVSSCFVTNETNETDHQWELLLVCFICFILFQSILEYSLYILIVLSVSVTEKKTCPKKNLRGFCAVSSMNMCLWLDEELIRLWWLLPTFQHYTGTRTKLIYIVSHKLWKNYQTCMNKCLWLDEELIRLWWLLPNFQHYTGTRTKLIYIVSHKLLEEFVPTFMKIWLRQDKEPISVWWP